jgi:orotidine-5'-phosphate decarboxylase
VSGRTRFQEKYDAAVERNDSMLCVGLDPDPKLIPPGVTPLDFLRSIIEATADLVCAYKPNAAFYEAMPDGGFETLRAVVKAVPADIPVLLDAKRGDIGNTASFYAKAVFEVVGADGVTVSPYLGRDALQPFLDYGDRTSFMLVRTSNPGAGDLQDLPIGEGGGRLYEHVARLANSWNEAGNVGLVVGATYPEEGRRIRELCPDQLILAPGIGAQEGEIETAVRALMDSRGGNVLVNASRGVLYAGSGSEYAQAARDEAARLRDAINLARQR